MFKFMHAADIHLDSPLLNLDQYDGAPVEVFRNATRAAFDNMIDLAINEQVQFILISGDLYDGECRDSSTPLHFRRQMVRLQKKNIRVFVIQGNHDAGVRKAFSFELPENVKLFSTRKPETVQIEDLQVAIHGQGFSDREVQSDLSASYPDAVTSFFNIGLLHTSCGHYEQHSSYAPSTIRGLTDKGYQYWALGHIHKREVLARGRCWIVYSGNTQGRNIRETGAKGCEIVSVDHGEVTQIQSRSVDVVRWSDVSTDVSDCETPEVLLDLIRVNVAEEITAAEGRPLAIRLRISGTTKIHGELMSHPDHWDRSIRESIVDRFDDQVWVEKIKLRTTAKQNHEDGDDAVRILLDGITKLDDIGGAIDEIRPEIDQLMRLIPTDPRLTNESVSQWNGTELDELTKDIKDFLENRLLRAESQA